MQRAQLRFLPHLFHWGFRCPAEEPALTLPVGLACCSILRANGSGWGGREGRRILERVLAHAANQQNDDSLEIIKWL